jgi:hypothetical protein
VPAIVPVWCGVFARREGGRDGAGACNGGRYGACWSRIELFFPGSDVSRREDES